MAQLQEEMLEKVDPVTTVQSCLSFLKENILKDQLLVDYFSACSVLSEEDKQDIRDRKNLLRAGRIVKSILQHGSKECEQLLGVIEKSSLSEDFQNYLRTKKGDRDSGKWNLTQENYTNHRETLLQEIEPSWIADIFLEERAITIDEHDELENAGTREEKCQKLLSLVETKVDLKMLTHALEKSRCISLLDVVTGKVPVIPADSRGIVKRNYRLLRQIIYDYLMMKDPGKKPIPEALLADSAKCKALLEHVREKNISLFEQVMDGSQKESKEGKNPTNITLGGKNFQHDFKTLMKDVEPVPLGDMFLEKDIYNREDYLRLQGLSTRKEQASAIIHFMFSSQKPGPIGDCLYQLNWFSLIDKLKFTENEKAYEDNKKKVKADEEGSIELKTEEVIQTAEELPSSLDLKISSSVPIEGGKQKEIIEALNSNTSLRKKIVELTHMNIQKAEKNDPLLLHLTSLTDEAVQRLVADNGILISKMVTTLLELMNLTKQLVDLKTTEINVTITAPTEKSRKTDISAVDLVKVKILQNWDLLVRELEPYQMLACFVSEGLLTDTERQQILSFKSRHDRVVSLLQVLLHSKNDALLNCFVQLLQLLNKNCAETFDSKDANTIHQKAEIARKYILLHFGETVEEIDSYIMKDTMHKYGRPVPESFSRKTNPDRKGRAYDFLMFVFENDGLVLELENALKCRGFGHFFEDVFTDTDETPQDKNQEHIEKKPKVHSLLSYKYSATLKEGYMERLEMYKLMEEERCFPFHHRDQRMRMFEREEIFMRMQRRRFRDLERRPEGKVSVPVPDYELGVCQVVFAIDLGTSYSGYAFSMAESPLDITAGKWKTQSSELLESPKTPTSLLLTSSDKFEAFGYDAEKRFKELVEENKHTDYRYFSQIKMELHKKKPLGTTVKVSDHMSRPMDALTVFSMTIEHLNKMCLEAVKEKNIPKGAMRWVLTIPSMWDNFAQQFMRKAAVKAGIPGPLLSLAFEPETAAIYNMKGSRTDLTTDSKQQYQTGSQILLADLGGGVADFSLIGVKEDGKLEMLHQSLGGEWGGNSINASLFRNMEELLGEKVMEEFRKQTSDFLEMENNIELKKRDVSVENKLILTMYPSLAMICKEQTGKTYKQLVEGSQLAGQVKVRTGKIIFEPEMINKVFEQTLTQSFAVMDELLATGQKVQDIILVGGFADSGIIQKKFLEKYSKYRVIIPTDPGLAVLKGAVIFGHDQNIIKSRICPHTYGVKVLRYGFATDTEDRKKVISGMTFGPGGFKTIVTKGKTLTLDKYIDVDFVSPSNFAQHLFLKFYQTDAPSMEGVSEEDCIGRVVMTLSEPPKRIPTFMRLNFKFGGIEMAVNGNFKRGWLQVPSEMNFLDSIP